MSNYLIRFEPNYPSRRNRRSQEALMRRRAKDARGFTTKRGFTKPQIRRSAWGKRA